MVETIYSDPADGRIIKNTSGEGSFAPQIIEGGSMIVGIAGTTQMSVCILLFELPESITNPLMIKDASLSVTVDLVQSIAATHHADLWGMGYQSGTTFLNSWYLAANSDPSAIGGGINIPDRMKIQDNFLTNAIVPTQTVTTTSPDLTTFLQTLYANGAQGGDYAIFRINTDYQEPHPAAFRRWRFFSGEAALDSDKPTLLITIPEPMTAMLLALPAVALLGRTRRRV